MGSGRFKATIYRAYARWIWSLALATDSRAEKGRAIASKPGSVTPLDEYRFAVRSESGPGSYLVSRVGGENWTCQCIDYRARRLPCKHIFAVIDYSSKKHSRSTTFFDQRNGPRPPTGRGPEQGKKTDGTQPQEIAGSRQRVATSVDRVARGVRLARLGNILRRQDGSFLVPSEKDPSKHYEVRLVRNRWVCECPDFQNRNLGTCKHIIAVTTSLMDYYTKVHPNPPQPVDTPVVCPRCNSDVVKPNGHVKATKNHEVGKPLYHCKICDKYFSEPSLWSRARKSPEVVVKILDWYVGGISLRGIQQRLYRQEGVNVSFGHLWKVLDKWALIINDFVRAQRPKLSGVVHVDEMALPVREKGVTGDKARGLKKWLWLVVDKETKFVLASVVTGKQSEVGTMRVMRSMMEAAKEPPDVIVSDKAAWYPRGIGRSFLPLRSPPVHFPVKGGAGEGKRGEPDNQQAERICNEFRERIKVQRGWKSDRTPLASLQTIYHNWVRPNRSLKNKTPGEVACPQLKLGRNKFLGLVMHTLGFLRFVERLPAMTFPCLVDTSTWL